MTGKVRAVSSIRACWPQLPIAGAGGRQVAKVHKVGPVVPAIRDLPSTPSTPTGPWTNPSPKWPQGFLRDSPVRFLGSGGGLVADGPKARQRLLKRVLSPFAQDESPAVRTRICCGLATGPTPGHANSVRGQPFDVPGHPSHLLGQRQLIGFSAVSAVLAPVGAA
jgi:hypothetical protein